MIMCNKFLLFDYLTSLHQMQSLKIELDNGESKNVVTIIISVCRT
jgi:flagellar assembly factor FliW